MFPIAYIVLAAALFDIPLSKCVGILLSPFYYIASLSVVIVGYGLWEMRRWSWYLFLISQVMIVYENAILVHEYAESHHKFLVFVLAVLFQIVLTFRVAKEIRVPYFFPRIRWWESNPRYRLSVPLGIKRKNGGEGEGEILDLSPSGCFAKVRTDFAMDESVSLKFRIYGFEIECEGKVVWCAQSAVTHPKGVGIKFGVLSKSQKRSLRIIARRLKKIASHYRRSRYLMSQEEFLKHLQELESTVQQ